MTVLVTDSGFSDDHWTRGFCSLTELATLELTEITALAVDVPNDTDVVEFEPWLGHIDLIKLQFPNFADGRAFTQARRLRMMGFTGRLRAAGPVLADQYAMIRRAGFDEVEIPEALAVRQPENEWLARANWQENDYQARLRQFAR